MKQFYSIIQILAIFVIGFGGEKYDQIRDQNIIGNEIAGESLRPDRGVHEMGKGLATITGEVTQQEVTAVFVLESDHINYLTFIDENGNEQIIESTDVHPFWVVIDEPDLDRAARSVVDENGVILYHENLESGRNGFWVEAKDLREGDVVLGANGELSTLVTKKRVQFDQTIKVYNFTVDGNHDYFVIAKCDEFGQTCVLVHNAICISPVSGDYVQKGLHVKVNGVEVSLKPGNNGTIVLKPTFATTSTKAFKEAKKIMEEAMKNPAAIKKLLSTAEHARDFLRKLPMQMGKKNPSAVAGEMTFLIAALKKLLKN